MKRGILFFIIILLVGGALFYVSQTKRTALPSDISSSSFASAPNFVLPDYAGNPVRFSDFEGKIAVINAWAVWCPFCRKELADFAALQKAFPDIAVIAVDRAESLEKAKTFTDSLGITHEMIFLLDPEDMFYRSIGGFSMPETIFTDKEGKIRFHKRGPMPFEEMKQEVEKIMRI